ncbi:MAG: ATP-dependent Clp protease proteolytic subunit [Proteobacteria bacterium]|nr:ATP-dependent Clp protease proteolytic subunit [Pseudomonadota bacterium]
MKNDPRDAGEASVVYDSEKKLKKSKLGLVASFTGAAIMGLSVLLTGSVSADAVPGAAAANQNGKSSLVNYDQEWTVRLSGPVTQSSAETVINKLRELNRKDPMREIELRINSGGGSVPDGLAIYDVMQSISNDIRTVCEGSAMSMSAVLLSSGTPGKRMAYGHCEIMIHELSAKLNGRMSDLKTWGEDADRANEKLINVLHHHTGLSRETLRIIMTQDINMKSTKEAKEMGMIDNIIPSKPLPPAAPRELPKDFCKEPERRLLGVCTVPKP